MEKPIRSFKCAANAQQFYLQQKNQMYWHWNYDTILHEYKLEYKDKITATAKVILIEEITDFDDDDEYVYDIEIATTDLTKFPNEATFQCGTGCLLLHNTDSIYVKFDHPEWGNLPKQQLLENVFHVSNQCAQEITAQLPPPQELEMEKVMCPLLLFTKKRYVANIYVSPTKNKGIDAKGIELVRRDNCLFVKEILQNVVEQILIHQNVTQAQKIAKQMIKQLLNGEIPIEKLIITKSLKDEYKDKGKNGQKLSKPAHFYLAERIKERDPMNAPKTGDRISYVYKNLSIQEQGKKNILQADRVEDPTFLIEKYQKSSKKITKQIDFAYYLDKQVANSLYNLFSLIVNDPETKKPYPLNKNNKISKECKETIAKLLWKNALLQYENRQKNQRMLSDFF